MNDSNTATAPDTAPQLSYGQKAVGIDFNPAGDPNVAKVKDLSAQLIDLIIGLPNEVTTEGNRLREQAIRQIQTAQMWAVKFITYKY